MKIFAFALFLCAGIMAVHIFDLTKKTNAAPPVLTAHIEAPVFTVDELISVAARKHNVSPALVKSIIAAESAFLPEAVSPKGAVGLMQLMPETAREMGADPSVPEQNVDAGTKYIGSLLRRYAGKRDQFRRAIAAYNAGPGVVEHYKGVPPYRETRAYVQRVMRFFKQYQNAEIASLR